MEFAWGFPPCDAIDRQRQHEITEDVDVERCRGVPPGPTGAADALHNFAFANVSSDRLSQRIGMVVTVDWISRPIAQSDPADLLGVPPVIHPIARHATCQCAGKLFR